MRVSTATPLVGTKVVHTRRSAATVVIALTMLASVAYVMSPGTASESPSSAKWFFFSSSETTAPPPHAPVATTTTTAPVAPAPPPALAPAPDTFRA